MHTAQAKLDCMLFPLPVATLILCLRLGWYWPGTILDDHCIYNQSEDWKKSSFFLINTNNQSPTPCRQKSPLTVSMLSLGVDVFCGVTLNSVHTRVNLLYSVGYCIDGLQEFSPSTTELAMPGFWNSLWRQLSGRIFRSMSGRRFRICNGRSRLKVVTKVATRRARELITKSS